MNSTRLKYLATLLAGAALATGTMTFLTTPPKAGDVVLSQVTFRPRYYPGSVLPDGGTFTDVRVQLEVCGQPVGRDGGLEVGTCAEFIAAPGSADEKLGASVLGLKSAKAAVRAAIQR